MSTRSSPPSADAPAVAARGAEPDISIDLPGRDPVKEFDAEFGYNGKDSKTGDKSL